MVHGGGNVTKHIVSCITYMKSVGILDSGVTETEGIISTL